MTMRRSLAVASVAILGGLVCLPVHAEVRDARHDGFTVENHVQVPVAPPVAWRMLVRDVDRWWPKDHSWWGTAGRLQITAQPGGCFCETAGTRGAEHLRVVFVDPPTLLRFRGGLGPLQGMGLGGVMEWRLRALDGGGTEVTWWYRANGATPDDLTPLAPLVDRVQAQQLGAFATFAQGKVTPLPR